ncbi:MAG: KEOPS complex kinase/ATPase Bud32 [Candidatus ainarchaeum sp.]|nr:KEOPS complex kinase/ATPase Bud32 [Candidatus ainarchaeum sp.]
MKNKELLDKFQKICAEATVTKINFEEKNAISKKRIKKDYRNELLDNMIRKRRTKSEAKIIKDLLTIINTPKIYSVDENNYEIIMEFIDGLQLKEIIEKKPKFCKIIGEEIKKIHDYGIIHGDLTTSNILIDKKNKIYFIDFGLSFYSKKLEDKAMDLVVFKKVFNATHSKLKNGFELVLNGYNPSKELIEQINKIEKRARYH